MGKRRKHRRWLKRVAIGAVAVVLALLALGFTLYEFGGMEPPAPRSRAAYAQMVAAGQARPVQARFVIPIPGCVCHSADPAQQVTHSVYRMHECGSCHDRGAPSP